MQEANFITNYRILVQLSENSSCILSLAEHTYQKTSPVLLIFSPKITLPDNENRRAFLEKARTGAIEHGEKTIPIQDASIENLHPYLVTAYSDEIQSTLQEHIKLVEQIFRATENLHPNDQQALVDAFLHTITAPPPSTPSPEADPVGKTSATTGRQQNDKSTSHPLPPRQKLSELRPKRWQAALFLILLLAILLGGGILLYPIIPAAAATVTITPVSKALGNAYDMRVGSGTNSDPSIIPGRQISYTSQKRTRTVAATGHGTHPAEHAKGKIVVSQIHLFSNASSPDQENVLGIRALPDANGLKFSSDESVSISEGATVTIPAHTDNAGSSGNIPAHDLDGPIDIVYLSSTIGSGYLSNPEPFTGGRDAVDFTFVQQADIDGVTKSLTEELTPDSKTQVRKQLHKDEHLVGDPQCLQNVSSNHIAKEEVEDVTVEVSLSCGAMAYTDQALHDAVVNAYKLEGKSKFGNGYDVAGDVIISKASYSATFNTFTIKVDGIWSFPYTAQQQQEVKNLIAGKSQQDALTLLRQRKEIQNVSLTTSGGIGSAVPTTPENIKFIIKKVPGLQA